MKNFLKKILKSQFRSLGYNISKISSETPNQDFDQILKKYLSKNPTIFDVGANQGQSIERFNKIFKDPIIHAFEPIDFEFKNLIKKYAKNKNIILNNFALGNEESFQKLNVTAKTGNSSFNEIRKGTEWLKKRSKQYHTNEEGYVLKSQDVKIKKLDQYCISNQINKIDLLKIDTQGYEDKVLEGSLRMIKENNISIVLTEVIFDNVYNNYLSFSDIEKFLIPENFRMVGINLSNNNLFSGIAFFADVMYFNKKIYGDLIQNY